jgi:hypothetical protein
VGWIICQSQIINDRAGCEYFIIHLRRTNTIFDYFYDGKEIQYLSDKDFEEYMLKATRYRADLLRITTQEILAMKDNNPTKTNKHE